MDKVFVEAHYTDGYVEDTSTELIINEPTPPMEVFICRRCGERRTNNVTGEVEKRKADRRQS